MTADPIVVGIAALQAGMISVTPLQLDLTAESLRGQLADALR